MSIKNITSFPLQRYGKINTEKKSTLDEDLKLIEMEEANRYLNVKKKEESKFKPKKARQGRKPETDNAKRAKKMSKKINRSKK